MVYSVMYLLFLFVHIKCAQVNYARDLLSQNEKHPGVLYRIA